MANRREKSANSGRFYFLGLQNHYGWWLEPWNYKTLIPWKKRYDKQDSLLESRNITFLTKVCIIKAMVFLVVVYMYDIWTIKKDEHQRINAFELWCWRRLLRIPWTARISTQSIIKEINLGYSLEGLMLNLKLQYFGHLMQKSESLEKTLMPGKIKSKRRRGWQRMRWLASLTQWTWIWANSRG